MLELFEVIWLFDGTALGEKKDRRMVCVNPEEGWFFRINSKPRIRPCVLIEKIPHHTRFLDHDSYIQCDVLEVDEYIIEESIRSDGVIGRVNRNCVDGVCETLKNSQATSEADKNVMINLLQKYAAS